MEKYNYIESTGTVVLTSIAGGSKTMSALLFSFMTLLGREDDKVLHVLLPPEFEGGVEPPMYYPVKGVTYTNRAAGKKYKSDKFHSELFEVPFVRMRGWYQDKFKSIPPSYRTLVSKIQTIAPPVVTYPEIEIDAWNGWITLNGKQVAMSKTCFAVFFLLASGCSIKELHARLLSLHASPGHADCDWLSTFREGSRFSDPDCSEDLNKTMSELRKRLKAVGFEHAETLFPQHGAAVTFPINRIEICNANAMTLLADA